MTSDFVVKLYYFTPPNTWTEYTTVTIEEISFTIDHEFNSPAEAVVVLRDVDGSLWRNLWGVRGLESLLGPGYITIEQPSGTTIFDGRMFTMVPNEEMGTFTILCRDWMDQLDDNRITYSMRDDLDGVCLGCRSAVVPRLFPCQHTTS